MSRVLREEEVANTGIRSPAETPPIGVFEEAFDDDVHSCLVVYLLLMTLVGLLLLMGVLQETISS